MTCATTPDTLALWGQLSPAQRELLEAVRQAGREGYLLAHPRGRTARALRDDLRLIERRGGASATWISPSSHMVLTELGAQVMEPPLCFLDMDGVVSRVIERRRLPGESEEEWKGRQATAHERLDEAAVRRLNRIVTATSARFVSSSTWREGQKPEVAARQIEVWMRAKGFEGRVIGATPELGPGRRGQEIQAWLDAQPVKPRAFAILDDWQPMGELAGRTVYTDGDLLLREHDVDRVIALLSPPARTGWGRRAPRGAGART